MYQFGKYSSDCISVIVSLVVATHKVAMDTFFCLEEAKSPSHQVESPSVHA